ncbi:sensor histidine kinase [Haloarcula halophila]|uniref:sensor histidine kinase n=1 Tax=Haloarcula TaxID=2237 RepID=UPI0023E3A4F3|nr:HAMP domain-containing sensor histidine kinase [Halomicroarcula sp. DFY41]
MSDIVRWNLVGLLGCCILLGTAAAAAPGGAPLHVLAIQSSLPVVLGLGLVVYGWWLDGGALDGHGWTVVRWTALGVVVFFGIGAFFGQISRRFDTSFLLAVVASLGFGATLGAVVGVYSARLQRTNDQLVRQRERMEQFTNMVSHDLRNPLNVASGQLELARRDHESEHLDAVAESHDRMESLIDDVLTLARERDPDLRVESVALPAVVDRAWRTVETDTATLRTETDATVLADPDRLQQLLENLFRNAAEHGGEAVTVGALDSGTGIYVEDDGPGFDDVDRVFESGYTTAESGTGLGLAIVWELAASHDWRVTATTGRDGGARIELHDVEFADEHSGTTD